MINNQLDTAVTEVVFSNITDSALIFRPIFNIAIQSVLIVRKAGFSMLEFHYYFHA